MWLRMGRASVGFMKAAISNMIATDEGREEVERGERANYPPAVRVV